MPERDVASWNAMMAGYTQNGMVNDGRQLFDGMPERDVISWNAMIAGYAQNKDNEEALKLYCQMQLAGYTQSSRIDDARRLFDRMYERNVVTWNAMIAGYGQNENPEEAHKLFFEMQRSLMKPDQSTFTSLLNACANLAALQQGKQCHGQIIALVFSPDVFLRNALITMYAKCGNIDNAWQEFKNMPERNVVSWNAMITGYAQHGYGQEALKLFEQMRLLGTKPNGITFVGVLCACCHAGLVDEGWHYFDSMSRDHCITPAADHYACLVDLLGRAGRLYEAADCIDKMSLEPDAVVWGALLGACRVHGNMELGQYAAEHLFELEPQNATTYVLLSNIYAAVGRWDDVGKVRTMMKDRGVVKIPGCSWVEIKNKVHAFLVGDTSHPQTEKIYAMLEKLTQQMKEAGYVPERNFVLLDVEEEQKESILLYHSEKLAIAFGLINTPSGTPIRIIKNLRVCGDCHTAAKLISKIVRREIVLRDTNRFHHFKDGFCSCGDYW